MYSKHVKLIISLELGERLFGVSLEFVFCGGIEIREIFFFLGVGGLSVKIRCSTP